MNRRTASGIAVAVLVGVPVGLYVYVRATAAPPQARGAATVPVVATPARILEYADSVEAVGTARANESVSLAARVTERVVAVHFADGDIVEKGKVLVELRSDEQEAQRFEELANVEEEKAALEEARGDLEQQRASLVEAQAVLNEQETQLERMKALFANGTLAQSELDAIVATVETARSKAESAQARIRSSEARIASAEARVRSAQARLQNTEARLQDTRIAAPFDGMLGFRNVSPGAVVSPGTVLTTVDDIRTIKLDFQVPERFLNSVRAGQEVVAGSVAFPGRDFRGSVASIDSRIDPVTRAFSVRALVDNPEYLLRPGMLLTVELVRERRPALMVPEQAVVPIGPHMYVFVVADGKAERREVTLGARTVGAVEVVSGLREGELVVNSGVVRLRPGAPVEVVETRAEFDLGPVDPAEAAP